MKTTDELIDIAHEIWAVAQLMPEEGIEDGVWRITKILEELQDEDVETS